MQDLVPRLTELARQDTRFIAQENKFSFLSAFVARQTETFHAINMPVAGLLIVLEGIKEISWAGKFFAYSPGMAFALPPRAYVDVINKPNEKSGMYRALFLGFSPDLLAEARRRWSPLAAGHCAADPTVKITPALASAILHASEALSGAIQVSERIMQQRILEVLLLLAETGAAPLRPDLKTSSTTDAVRFVIRNDLARAWTAAAVAKQLCTSEPTLRRRLRLEKSGFREIMAEERMRAAHGILAGGRGVTEAALAAGYASSSHFAKRFLKTYGYLPSRLP